MGLTFFSHHAADVAPEAALMCIIDCDLEGQADLVARDDIVPPVSALASYERYAALLTK